MAEKRAMPAEGASVPDALRQVESRGLARSHDAVPNYSIRVIRRHVNISDLQSRR